MDISINFLLQNAILPTLDARIELSFGGLLKKCMVNPNPLELAQSDHRPRKKIKTTENPRFSQILHTNFHMDRKFGRILIKYSIIDLKNINPTKFLIHVK